MTIESTQPSPNDRDLRIREAQKAHQRGWALTPLNGKAPTTKGWQRAPFPTAQQAHDFAAAGNVGVRTGQISGIVVIDDDTPDGSAAVALNLPTTATVITGRGRRHYYFHCPPGRIKNSAGRLGTGIDVRGDGGQVVFVGSIHPETQKPYLWAAGLSPDDVPIAPLPPPIDVLLRQEQRTAKKTPRRPARVKRYAAAALATSEALVARAPVGQRNDTLNREAFKLGHLVASEQLQRDEVEAALSAAARRAGLPDDEIAATLASGLDAGIARPGDATGELPTMNLTPRLHRPAENLPDIYIAGGELPDTITQAEKAMLALPDCELFQRGTTLCYIIRLVDAMKGRSGEAARGRLLLHQLDVAACVDLMTAAANFILIDKNGMSHRVDCTDRIARSYLARAGRWSAPPLVGVIEAPTLRRDGTILSTEGYDFATALYFDPGDVEFPPIPDEPSRDDATQALQVLLAPIAEFPWLEPCDRAAALAAILTALIRRSLRTAPLFAFRAPKMSSGKSLLCDIVAMIATGRVAAAMIQGHDEDEIRKRMLAILREGEPVACIDNCEHPLGGAALCSVLTQQTWRDRILGQSETAIVPTNITLLANGNNLQFYGDITTRVVVCDLDPGCERPEQRRFSTNLYKYVPQHRGELVAAALTLLRAYHVAGRPDQGLTVFGRFEEWSDWVRSTLVWVGEADCCAGAARIELTDAVSSLLRAVLLNWHALVSTKALTAAELVLQAQDNSSRAEARILLDAFKSVAGGRDDRPDTRRLGSWLAKHERRQEAGLRLERLDERQGVATWRVVRV
jgi:hypothetical protein